MMRVVESSALRAVCGYAWACGWAYQIRGAGRSTYVTLWRGMEQIKVRISDHGSGSFKPNHVTLFSVRAGRKSLGGLWAVLRRLEVVRLCSH